MKIIAEVGSNWKTFQDVEFSIDVAKHLGADAVKFQLFTSHDLYGKENIDEFGSPFLNEEWIPQLYRICKDIGIEFMCTGFSPRTYNVINYYADTHKIASAELTDTNILELVNSYGKPVYLSTGGASYDEIRMALLKLKNCPVTIMYCVADYPAKVVDFRQVEILKELFGTGYSYGYSDHSIDVLNIPRMAKEHGCSVIEKHVNFSGYTDTNDAPHALDDKEFLLMVNSLRGIPISPKEIAKMTSVDMQTIHKRKFVATENISQGSKLKIGENVGIYRSKYPVTNPVSTFRPWDLNGKVAVRSIQKGEPICYQDLDEHIRATLD